MQGTTESLVMPATSCKDVLTEVLRNGAQELLAQAIEAEVADWIESHKQIIDEKGHRAVVRNGHMPARSIVTGIGPVSVRQPRVRNRRPDGADERPPERFHSKILPPYLINAAICIRDNLSNRQIAYPAH